MGGAGMNMGGAMGGMNMSRNAGAMGGMNMGMNAGAMGGMPGMM